MAFPCSSNDLLLIWMYPYTISLYVTCSVHPLWFIFYLSLSFFRFFCLSLICSLSLFALFLSLSLSTYLLFSLTGRYWSRCDDSVMVMPLNNCLAPPPLHIHDVSAGIFVNCSEQTCSGPGDTEQCIIYLSARQTDTQQDGWFRSCITGTQQYRWSRSCITGTQQHRWLRICLTGTQQNWSFSICFTGTH